jgi:hypothetical protein
MATLRRRLRVCATIWLLFQTTWLLALVPRDCCAAHLPDDATCHRAASAVQCPMRGPDGRPCPMHREAAPPQADTAQGHEHQHGTDPTGSDCQLKGSCAGPMSALLTLLSNHGILPDATDVETDVTTSAARIGGHPDATGTSEPPDPPPPRG